MAGPALMAQDIETRLWAIVELLRGADIYQGWMSVAVIVSAPGGAAALAEALKAVQSADEEIGNGAP